MVTMLLDTIRVLALEAKRLLIDVALAVATDKDGATDVVTGCANAFEPTFNGQLAFKHHIGAMELWAVELDRETAVERRFRELYNKADVLLPGDRDPGGQGEGDGGYGWGV